MALDRREIVTIDIPVAMHTVWEHLRQPQLIHRWYGWDHPGLDAEIRRVFVERVVEAHVFEADRTVTQLPVEGHDVVGDRTVRTLSWPHRHDVISVSASVHDPSTTRFTVTRPGQEGRAGYDGVRDEDDENWIAFGHQLQFALTAQPGQDRRTLSVFGLDAGDRHDRLLTRAGLHGIRGIPLGGHVQARRPDGTLLGGTLAYKSEMQFGIALHGITESFLVVLETPVAAHPPNGTVAAILSTYGLDDATFAQVEERWSAWWGRAVPRGTTAARA